MIIYFSMAFKNKKYYKDVKMKKRNRRKAIQSVQYQLDILKTG